jgi:hypothetical protein
MTPTQSASLPTFRVHAPAPAFVRGVWVVALCAALTAGFLLEVSHAPAGPAASTDAVACTPGQGHAC